MGICLPVLWSEVRKTHLSEFKGRGCRFGVQRVLCLSPSGTGQGSLCNPEQLLAVRADNTELDQPVSDSVGGRESRMPLCMKTEFPTHWGADPSGSTLSVSATRPPLARLQHNLVSFQKADRPSGLSLPTYVQLGVLHCQRRAHCFSALLTELTSSQRPTALVRLERPSLLADGALSPPALCSARMEAGGAKLHAPACLWPTLLLSHAGSNVKPRPSMALPQALLRSALQRQQHGIMGQGRRRLSVSCHCQGDAQRRLVIGLAAVLRLRPRRFCCLRDGIPDCTSPC